jgi:hypothetical protein
MYIYIHVPSHTTLTSPYPANFFRRLDIMSEAARMTASTYEPPVQSCGVAEITLTSQAKVGRNVPLCLEAENGWPSMESEGWKTKGSGRYIRYVNSFADMCEVPGIHKHSADGTTLHDTKKMRGFMKNQNKILVPWYESSDGRVTQADAGTGCGFIHKFESRALTSVIMCTGEHKTDTDPEVYGKLAG